MRRSPSLVIACLALVALGASACASGDDEPVTESGSGEPSGTTMAASTPLGAFFEADGGFEAALRDYTTLVEEEIVVCMAAQGFEFRPSAPQVFEADRLQRELTTREWRSRFGYGISTTFDTVFEQQTTDPNTEILFSLTPEERDLWLQTLTGVDQATAALLDEPPPLEEQGCIGEAITETGGSDALDGLENFSNAYDEAQNALFDEPDVVVAVAEWSRCLSELGYEAMAERGDPEDSINSRFLDIVLPIQSALADVEPEEAQAFLDGASEDLAEVPGLDVEALRELQADEIELALADWDCYLDHVQAVYEPRRDELENGLIDEYRTELDSLREIGS